MDGTHCKPNEHVWEATRGGRERCKKCTLTYPCLLDCDHVNCRVDKGQPMPDGIRYVGTFERGERIA
jgi:hypothetical protein